MYERGKIPFSPDFGTCSLTSYQKNASNFLKIFLFDSFCININYQFLWRVRHLYNSLLFTHNTAICGRQILGESRLPKYFNPLGSRLLDVERPTTTGRVIQISIAQWIWSRRKVRKTYPYDPNHTIKTGKKMRSVLQ